MDSTLNDYLKEKLSGLYRSKPAIFRKLLLNLDDKGIYEPSDLSCLKEDDIESFGLPKAQDEKLRNIIKEHKSK